MRPSRRLDTPKPVLVQMMEKEGIGRPSTYASIISTIIDRGYVNKSGNALVPSFTAMIVSRLLNQHLPTYVDLGFTTEMENKLDDIAGGELDSMTFSKVSTLVTKACAVRSNNKKRPSIPTMPDKLNLKHFQP
jgi:DNA topoisomerase IA